MYPAIIKNQQILMMNFHIETYLVKMTRAQMIFRYRMRRASDGALLATGETKNAFMSKSTGKLCD